MARPEGVYSVSVISIGAFAHSLSTQTWDSSKETGADPNTYTLLIGEDRYEVTGKDNTAASVASAINARYGSLVRATAVNVGPADTPDYRISLQSATLGPVTLDLLDPNEASLQSQQDPPGEEAQYEVNGSGVTVSSTTRSVKVATGLTLNLQSPSSAPVDITVIRSTAALSTALSAFADAYNAGVDEIAKQRGQSGGALQGKSIVTSLSQTLSSISTYSSSSGISGLRSLGVVLETDGHVSFSQFALMAADFSNSMGVTTFLGSTTGGGFLKTASDALKRIENPVTGLLKVAVAESTTQSTKLGDTIFEKQDKVSQLQIQLQNQMARADAMIAAMEQQYSYMTSMFSAMQTANQMYSR